jgi:hypothetical protein
MNKQYYVREGSQFVKADVPSVVDHRGEYYNADGSFSKEKKDDSVGVCIMQNPAECIICGLNEYKNVTHNGILCRLHNFPDWRLGEQEEMHIAAKFYREKLNLMSGEDYYIYAYDSSYDYVFCFDVRTNSSRVGTAFSNHLLRLFKTVKL